MSKNDFGQALIDAARRGSIEVVTVLLNHGADIHAENDQALFWAAANSHKGMIRYLIDNGAKLGRHGHNARFYLKKIADRDPEFAKYLSEIEDRI